MRATAGPDALDALLSVAHASVTDVEVVDTYTLSPGDAAQLILGASDPQDPNGNPGMVSTQDRLDGFGEGRVEAVTVRCLLSAPVEEPALARQFLLAKLTEFDAGIRVARSLSAHLGPDFSWSAVDTSSGDALACEFSVVIEAFV